MTRRRDRIRPTCDCPSYSAGHHPHYIQVNRAGRDRDSIRRGRVTATGGDWLDVVFFDGGHGRYLNHDIPRLRDLVTGYGPRVVVQDRWSLLSVRNFAVSIWVVDRGALSPCGTDDLQDLLAAAVTRQAGTADFHPDGLSQASIATGSSAERGLRRYNRSLNSIGGCQ